eukprot:423273-Rhodomonas_salina.1
MPPGDYGCVVTNPPYGERLDDSQVTNRCVVMGIGSGNVVGVVEHYPCVSVVRCCRVCSLSSADVRRWLCGCAR